MRETFLNLNDIRVFERWQALFSTIPLILAAPHAQRDVGLPWRAPLNCLRTLFLVHQACCNLSAVPASFTFSCVGGDRTQPDTAEVAFDSSYPRDGLLSSVRVQHGIPTLVTTKQD